MPLRSLPVKNPNELVQVVVTNELPFTIVGVTPPGFFGFRPGENPDLWWPLIDDVHPH